MSLRICRLEVLSYDFQASQSESKNQAVARCRQILSSGQLAEAQQLWEALVTIAKELRIGIGTITLTQLWDRLRASFVLRGQGLVEQILQSRTFLDGANWGPACGVSPTEILDVVAHE
jgi:hypothetical protein